LYFYAIFPQLSLQFSPKRFVDGIYLFRGMWFRKIFSGNFQKNGKKNRIDKKPIDFHIKMLYN